MSIMEQRLGPGMLYEGPSLEPGIVRTYPDGIMWLIKPDGTRCIIPCAGGGGGGAPVDAEYVVLALNATLTAERVLTAGDALLLTDGGAGGPVTLDVLVDGTSIQVNGLNQLEVVGGTSAPVNAEYVVMSLDPTLTDERVLTAGDGLSLTDGGAGGNATLDVLFDGVSIGLNGTNQLEVIGGALTNAVIKNPGSSTRNQITSTGNFVELPIVGAPGQTADLFTVAVDGMVPFFRLFADRTIGIGAGTFTPATYEGFSSIYVFSRNPLVAGGGTAVTPGAGVVSIPMRLDTEVSPTANTSTIQNFHTKIVYDTAFTSPTVSSSYTEASFRGMKAAGSGAQVGQLFGFQNLTDQNTASTGDITTMRGLSLDIRGRGTGTIGTIDGILSAVALSNNNPPISGSVRSIVASITAGAAGGTVPAVDGVTITASSAGRAVTLMRGLNIGPIGGTNVVTSAAIDIASQAAVASTTKYSIRSQGGQSLLQAGAATVIPLTVQGAAVQTARLQRWEDSALALLVGISAAGVVEFGSAADVNLYRGGANQLKTDDDFAVDSSWLIAAAGFINGVEIATPATPAANNGRLYFRDSGGGVTQLIALWPSGNTTVVAEDF